MYRVFFLVALLFVACTNLETTRPKVETISESVYASGIVKSGDQYEVFSTVNGVISAVMVTEGARVGKGEVVMQVRNELSRLNAENAKLAAAHSQISANKNKLNEAEAAMELARVKLKDDSIQFVRQRNLRRQGIGTQVEFEQRELAYKSSSTNYQIAVLNYRDLQRDLQFASEQSRNNLKISNSVVNDYSIRSEISGKVYKLFKNRGEVINTLSPVALIGDADEFDIEMSVDEYDISRIRPNQRVLVTMGSYPGEVFEARVAEIEPFMNDRSRSFIVRAVFMTRPPLLYPNLSVEANIIIREKQAALTIPRSYLLGDSAVMVGKHEKRKVIVGIMDYQKAEIVNGLTEADLIYKVNP